MNIVFWLLVIFALVALWYVSIVIVVPLINIWLKKLDEENELDRKDKNNVEED